MNKIKVSRSGQVSETIYVMYLDLLFCHLPSAPFLENNAELFQYYSYIMTIYIFYSDKGAILETLVLFCSPEKIIL
jgi:hypothetical protein